MAQKTKKLILQEKEAVEAALLAQLETLGLTQKHYAQMACDYADLYEIKELLKNDIRKRGVMTEYNHGGGQTGWKRNDAVQELPKIQKAMEGILMSLGLRATQIQVSDDGVEI